MVESAAQLDDRLRELKEKRKTGELGTKEFYHGLLLIMQELSASLIEELGRIEDTEVRTQIPLLLMILDEQITAFSGRE